MKKIAALVAVLGLIAVAGFFTFRSSVGNAAGERGVSRQTALSLQKKIDEIKRVNNLGQPHDDIAIDVTEDELESYVVYSLKDSIPVQLDSIDVQLTPGEVGSDTQLTFNSNSTGNPMVDAVVAGTHNLTVKGKLSGENSRGKFDLDEVKVDGIPVPKILIQSLFDRYVKPKYPDADLKEPFDLPWGIRSINIQPGTARIVY